ncbi:hypothetical protein DLJ60_22920 [Micromonospora chalcea]|uniref:Uncharacterized protein n=1 Tax=Micromonospora chalcea TaxID=1874 RepID=A0ABX9XYM2_MICCH|nr:hypothetical protein DLJ60_22920 [Micromonospora chalcea]
MVAQLRPHRPPALFRGTRSVPDVDGDWQGLGLVVRLRFYRRVQGGRFGLATLVDGGLIDGQGLIAGCGCGLGGVDR